MLKTQKLQTEPFHRRLREVEKDCDSPCHSPELWPCSEHPKLLCCLFPYSRSPALRLTFIKLSSRVATSSLGATDAVCCVRSHHSRPGPRVLRLVGPKEQREWGHLVRGGRALMGSNPRCDSDPQGEPWQASASMAFSFLIYTSVDGQEGPAYGSVY